MTLEYDQTGENFLYFILPVYTFILTSVTYWLFYCRGDENQVISNHADSSFTFVSDDNGYRIVDAANKPHRKRQSTLT
ncbi:hypothetical protein I4U23_027494 [Adineta vaga]|nr:hypothetical protein I4U23_027494 [Adineta vaga]